MRITGLKITGFKSFVDGVVLPIDSGLTGIVGPNGCGKSNILEALRWVMGASSAKALRGAEMDDVIFAGTETRPARDIAEVVVYLDNSNARAPEPFKQAQTLEIIRRIRRGIGSTFKVNGKEVRAKDVQLLFADSSTGANSPALVRQGQVSELINAKPENRRRVIEEAAGISGLQARRHEAQTKLAATETNLERISEILIHMDEHISNLKREARRAEKYRGLAENIRGFETYLMLQRYTTLQANLQKAKTEFEVANSNAGQTIIEINKASKVCELIESTLPAAREEQAIASAVLRRIEDRNREFERERQFAQEQLILCQENIKRITQDRARETELCEDAELAISENQTKISQIEDVASIEREANSAQIAADEAHEILQALEANLNLVLGARAKINAEWQNANSAKAALDADALRIEGIIKDQNAKKAQVVANAIKADELNIALANIKAKETAQTHAQMAREALQKDAQDAQTAENNQRQANNDIQHKFNKLKAQIHGLGAVIGTGSPKLANPALNQIKVKKGFEKAVAAAFGDDLEAQIGESGNMKWLGASFEPSEMNTRWPQDILGNLLLLADVVTAPKELSARLNAIAVVEYEVFTKLTSLPFGLRIVTKGGDMRRWDGYVRTPNAQMPSAIRLEKMNELAALLEQLPEVELHAKNAAQNLAHARANAASLQAKANQSANLTPNLMRELAAAQSEFAKLEAQKMRQDNEISQLAQNIDWQSDQLLGVKSRLKSLKQLDADNFRAELETANQNIDKISAEVQKARLCASQALSTFLSLSREQTNRENALVAMKSEIQNWQTRQERAQSRLKELAGELSKQEAAAQIARSKPEEIEKARQSALSELPKIEARKAAADDKLVEIEKALREANLELRACENKGAAAREAANSAQILMGTWQERITELRGEIATNFNFDADELPRRAAALMGSAFDDMSIEKAQSRLARALQDRETLGGVNLRADIELKEQTERAEKLQTESQDLLGALAKLKKAIDEINAQGREKLLAAFEIVNGHFSQLFSALFDGGAAHLALTETDDPLGGGLEVYACPPGKRLQTMSLMSGGEQALTATALIFAVFLSNPAPVSVLDELDAPLDDANVDRFCRLMDEMRNRTNTRFICITHHPITMARMDRLFGITMAERGVSQIVAVDLSRAEAMIEG